MAGAPGRKSARVQTHATRAHTHRTRARATQSCTRSPWHIYECVRARPHNLAGVCAHSLTLPQEPSPAPSFRVFQARGPRRHLTGMEKGTPSSISSMMFSPGSTADSNTSSCAHECACARARARARAQRGGPSLPSGTAGPNCRRGKHGPRLGPAGRLGLGVDMRVAVEQSKASLQHTHPSHPS